MENSNPLNMSCFFSKTIISLIGLILSYSIMADEQQPLLLPAKLIIQSGDLIFREGTQPVSDVVLNLDTSGYSHVGMLYKNEQTQIWYVLHATPSEIKGKPDSVVLDTLAFYLSSQNAKKYAIYRVQATNEQHQQAVNFALSQQGTPFDITAKQGTYCTLLMLDAWKAANIDLQVSFSRIELPFVAGDYLLPKDLRASPKLTEIYTDQIN